MMYSLFNFSTKLRAPFTFDGPRHVRDLCDPNYHCVIMKATTIVDMRYLGAEWQCNHCLPPLECITCNPMYREAVIQDCSACAPAMTWHLHGNCLLCQSRETAVMVNFLKRRGFSDDLLK